MGSCTSKDIDTGEPGQRKTFIPGYVLDGTACFLGDPSYEVASYQYASSSYVGDGSMQPAIVVFAKSEQDIIQVINYARSKNLAIAIRTGGHQYCGASSTSGPNIQLDISQAFDDDFEHYLAEDGTDRVRMGVTNSLLKVNRRLGELGLFVPHGECENVHVGGHMHTGGYGMLYRSFGLFGDHIRAFDIITADGKKQTVTKTSNPDLFYAVLGGCPGAFGVTTHVVIEPHRDDNHPNSRGMVAVYKYDRDRLTRLLDLSIQIANDSNLPLDFDFTCTVVSLNQEFFHLYPNIDQHMKARHPEIFDNTDNIKFTPNAIIVFAQWANRQGARQKYDENVKAWFDKIKAAIHGQGFEEIISRFGGKEYIDNDVYTPMSILSKSWVFQTMREYDLPYIKRLYVSKDILDRKFVSTVVDRVDEIQRNVLIEGCKISAQFQPNGQNSKVRMNSQNGTAYNFRDCTYTFTFDAFYEARGKEFARKWQQTNDRVLIGPSGVFSKRDIRLFWGSFGNRNLTDVWQCYYESEEVYERIKKIKEKVDPYKIFSPNDFVIGGARRVRGTTAANQAIPYDDATMLEARHG